MILGFLPNSGIVIYVFIAIMRSIESYILNEY